MWFFLLILLTVSFSQEVYLVTPLTYGKTILWSNASIWDPFPPTSDSIVIVDGGKRSPILVLDTSPLLHSLHLSNVTLLVDVENVEISGNLTCKDCFIKSLTDGQVNLAVTGFDVEGNTELVNVNLEIPEFDHLETELFLTNSIVLIERTDVFVDTYDQLLAWCELLTTGHAGVTHGLLTVNTDEVFASIDGGESHTVGITSEGTLFTWGCNSFGQLGLGHNKVKHFPTQVSSLSNVVQITTGAYHSLARLDDDTVWSWGKGESGQLGHGDTSDQPLPKRIESLSEAIVVSAGGDHSLAVLSDGSVKAWGKGNIGQLGNGKDDTTQGFNYIQFLPDDVSTATQVKKVLGCPSHSLFITAQNELMVSGSNRYGSLCLGDTNHRNTPQSVVDISLYRVTQASCGSSYTIFFTEEGDVYSCGRLLGRSTDIVPRHTPGKVEGLTRIRSIVGGGSTVFALDFNNVLFSWESGDETASRTTNASNYDVINVYTGNEHFFITATLSPSSSPTTEPESVNVTFFIVLVIMFVVFAVIVFVWWLLKMKKVTIDSFSGILLSVKSCFADSDGNSSNQDVGNNSSNYCASQPVELNNSTHELSIGDNVISISRSLIFSLCKTISNIKEDLAEWQPQQFIDTVTTPVISTVTLLSSQSSLFGPAGSALGALFSTIKKVKINKTQAAVLGGRVLRVTKLTFTPIEAHPELTESPVITEVLDNFVDVCCKVNSILKQHDDSKWFKKAFVRDKFKREFEMCNKLLEDFSSELLKGFVGKTYGKLPPLSSQKMDAIVDYDQEDFQEALASHNRELLRQLRIELSELQKQIASSTENSVKVALEEQQMQHAEERKALQKQILDSQATEELEPNIQSCELEILWETSTYSGQSEVVFAEYEMSDVVVKLYYGSGTISPELSREYSILKSLPNVPSLPRVYGLVAITKNGKDRFGLVMERLSNMTLKDKIGTIKKETEKLNLLISIANALTACHESKFLHRDLKPDNILFRGGCPVIIDWGSGKNIGNSNMSLSLNSNRILTPTWASPELVADETVYTDTIDVFSFALIVIYVFTEESLWQDFEGSPNRDQLIIQSLRSGDIPDVPYHPSIPNSLLPLLQQCLKFRYIDRPNMSQVVTVLTAFRYNKSPLDCLNNDNQVLNDFGLGMIKKQYMTGSSFDDAVEIFSKILKLLECCYSKENRDKFLSILAVIESHHTLPSKLISRKTNVVTMLDSRFATQEKIPVFDVNNIGNAEVQNRNNNNVVDESFTLVVE
ncbi:hypothetical protein P9112_009625 [Eukaryota sp. TZLM1-RC]